MRDRLKQWRVTLAIELMHNRAKFISFQLRILTGTSSSWARVYGECSIRACVNAGTKSRRPGLASRSVSVG